MIAERLEKERAEVHERVTHHTMSRTSSHNTSHRGETRTGHPTTGSPVPAPAQLSSPKAEPRSIAPTANVRPSFSFASAAAGKKGSEDKDDVSTITEKIDEVELEASEQ